MCRCYAYMDIENYLERCTLYSQYFFFVGWERGMERWEWVLNFYVLFLCHPFQWAYFVVWKDNPIEHNSWFLLKYTYKSYKYCSIQSLVSCGKERTFFSSVSQLIEYQSNSWYWATKVYEIFKIARELSEASNASFKGVLAIWMRVNRL